LCGGLGDVRFRIFADNELRFISVAETAQKIGGELSQNGVSLLRWTY
jgi:hypothetical protein